MDKKARWGRGQLENELERGSTPAIPPSNRCKPTWTACATAYITCKKPTSVVGRSMEKLQMLENLEMQEVALPKSLERWNDYNLSQTYNFTKRSDLKSFIASEFWWRTEMLLLRNT